MAFCLAWHAGLFLAASALVIASCVNGQAQPVPNVGYVREALTQVAQFDPTCGSGIQGNVFAACRGDCNDDGEVSVDEVIRLVNIVLGSDSLPSCSALLGTPSVVDAVSAVNSALYECPAVARYRLTDESNIIYYPPSPEIPVEEPLSGDFTAVNDGFELQFIFVARVTTLELTSPNFKVTSRTPGEAGCLKIPIFPPPSIMLQATVAISGQAVGLLGGAPISGCCSAPDTISGLEVCGGVESVVTCESIQNGSRAGFALTIFAVQENGVTSSESQLKSEGLPEG